MPRNFIQDAQHRRRNWLGFTCAPRLVSLSHAGGFAHAPR